jgi:SAM-dependent methyltransferase
MDRSRLDRERAFHDDRFSDDSDRTAAKKYYSVTRASEALVDSVLDRVPPGSRVLELGCGVTNHAEELGRRGMDVVAIDLSPVAVGEMRDRVHSAGLDDRVSVRVMNAEDLDFAAGSCDLVVGTGILHHLDLEAVYEQLAQVLANDGVGVFVEPLGRNPLINLYRALTPRMRTADEHPLVEADFDHARRHFASVRVDYFNTLSLGAVPFRRSDRFDGILTRLEAADAGMFTRWPRSRALAWTSVIQLRRPIASRSENAREHGS